MRAGTRGLQAAASLMVLAALQVVSGCSGFFSKPSSTSSGGTGSGTVTPTQSGDWMYVANAAALTATGFQVGTGGTLTALSGSPYTLGYIPTAAVVARSNTLLYVAALGAIYVYTIAGNGSLTASATGADVAIATVGALAVSPDGQWLFGLDANTQRLDEWAINASTGALTSQTGATYSVTSGAVQPSSLQVAPSGNYIFGALGPGGDVVFSLTTSNGAVSLAQTLATGSTTTNDNAVLVNSASSILYVARSGTYGGVAAFTIGSQGVLNSISGSPFAAGGGTYALAVDGTGDYLYAANRTSGTISGYAIGTTGGLTALSGSPFAAGTGTSSLATDNTGAYLMATNTGGTPDAAIYSINSTTGNLASVATVPSGTTAAGAIAVAASH